MTDDGRHRKEPAGDKRRAIDRCLAFVDTHPRCGWYVALLATLNFGLNLIDLWH